MVLVGSLVFALAACGGDDGGGDDSAFCDSLEVLSDQVADGDLGNNDGLEDAVETANDLLEAAGSDQEDAVRAVGEALAEADADDAADTAETVQDELGDLADDCEIDEFAEAPEETTTTTTEPEEETTTTTEPDDGTDTTDGGGGIDPEAIDVNGRDPIPADIAAEFLPLAQACFDGDPVSCDDLFAQTPAGSVDEAYGDTCAGRIDDGQGFSLECATLMTPAVPVPAEVVDQANAQACFGGSMIACDDMFRAAAAGTVDQAYGGLCGGRVQDTAAFCVDIFGDTALFL